MVEDITAPGGVRAAPPKESMNIFINRSVGVAKDGGWGRF